MPLQQTGTTWFALNGSNDDSASGIVDIRTGETIWAGGFNVNDYFDLTEQEANDLSWTDQGGLILHAGRYRRVQLHAGATPANVKAGTIGSMVPSLVPELGIVTSYDQGTPGVRIVVFLNVVGPGKFCWIQELGVASCLASGGTLYGPVGPSGTTGLVGAGTAPNIIGNFLDAPVANTPARVLLNLPVVQG